MGAKLNRGGSRQDYGTPPEFLDAVKKRLDIDHFEWDLAASEENTVGNHFYSEKDNSLVQDWSACWGWLWLNPPFSNITSWVKKASEESLKGAAIAMLVPASVGSNWWRDHVHNQAHVLFLNGRLTFVGEKDPYPKDCSLLLYTKYSIGGYEVWDWRNNG